MAQTAIISRMFIGPAIASPELFEPRRLEVEENLLIAEDLDGWIPNHPGRPGHWLEPLGAKADIPGGEFPDHPKPISFLKLHFPMRGAAR